MTDSLFSLSLEQKSENLLLDSNNKVKVCDFGFARRVDKKLDKLSGKKKHAQLTIAGTDEWMAPEVIQGVPYGQSADMFSLGITLTEIILRVGPEERHPRNAFDFEIEEYKTALAERASDCPPEFAALAIECCKYEPAQRPEAKVLVRGLKELLKIVLQRAKTEAAPKSPEIPPVVVSDAPSSANTSEPTTPPRLAVPESVLLSPRADLQEPWPPYVGLIPSDEDNELASMAPSENGLFRGVRVSSKLGGRRLKWIQFQDATPSDHQGPLKASFGPDHKKELKLYFVLCSDVLYYFKSNKKGEKNIGRILVDSSIDIALGEIGKKKMGIVLTNWVDESVRLIGPLEDIKAFNSALLQAKSADMLNLPKVFQAPITPMGMTALTQDPSTYSFPVKVAGVATKLLLCITNAGVWILSAFLEDVLLELKWDYIEEWQISRNEHIDLKLVIEKKKIVLELSCLAWAQAAQVFSVLERLSKAPGAMPIPKSPRTSVGGVRMK